MSKNACLRILALACMTAPVLALAQECGPVMGKSYCAADEYGVGYPQDDCTDDTAKTCMPENEAPNPIMLECYPRIGGFRCNVWPRSVPDEDPLHYIWQGGGTIHAGSSALTTSHTRDVRCLGGTPNNVGFVTVTVISPFGLESSTSIGLQCGSQAR